MPCIDWMPFFNAWEFAGKPDIVARSRRRRGRRGSLYADARRMLEPWSKEKWLRAAAVIGIFPALQRGRRRHTMMYIE